MNPEVVRALFAALQAEDVDYVLKRDTVRPQDKVDAQLLKDRFKLED